MLNIFLYIIVVSRIQTKPEGPEDFAACTTTDTSSVSIFNLTIARPKRVSATFDSLV